MMLIKLENRINRLMDWVGAIAAVLLILLVLVITFNVLNRYLFKISTIGVGFEELAWHFYAACFLLGIPFALRSGSHVRVDLIFENLSERTRAIIDLVGSCVFLIPMCLVVIWGGWIFTAESWGFGSHPDGFGDLVRQIVTTGVGEKTQDPGGLLNRWIIKGVIPLSFALLLLAAISFMIHKVNVLLGFSYEEDNESGAHGQVILDAGKGDS